VKDLPLERALPLPNGFDLGPCVVSVDKNLFLSGRFSSDLLGVMFDLARQVRARFEQDFPRPASTLFPSLLMNKAREEGMFTKSVPDETPLYQDGGVLSPEDVFLAFGRLDV